MNGPNDHDPIPGNRSSASSRLDRAPWRSNRSTRAEALRAIDQSARRADAQACFELGASFDTGWDMPCDRAEALRWLGRAAKLGHGVARAVLLQALLNRTCSSAAPMIAGAPGVVGIGPDWDLTPNLDASACIAAARDAIESIQASTGMDDAIGVLGMIAQPRADAERNLPMLSALVTSGDPSNQSAMLLAFRGILDIRIDQSARGAIRDSAQVRARRGLPPRPILVQASRIGDGAVVTVHFWDGTDSPRSTVGRIALPRWTVVQEHKKRVPDRRFKSGYRLEDGEATHSVMDCGSAYASANAKRLIHLMQQALDSGTCSDACVPRRFRRIGPVPFVRYRSLRCGYPDPGTILNESCLETHHSWIQYFLPVPLYIEMLHRAAPKATWLNIVGMPNGLGWGSWPADLAEGGSAGGSQSRRRWLAVAALTILLTLTVVGLRMATIHVAQTVSAEELARIERESSERTMPHNTSAGRRGPLSKAPATQRDFIALWNGRASSPATGSPDDSGRSQNAFETRLRTWLDAHDWQVRDWVGRIESIDSSPLLLSNPPTLTVELKVRIDDDMLLSHTRRVDSREFILSESELGRRIDGLQVGDAVRFSGTFPRAQNSQLGFNPFGDLVIRMQDGNPVFAFSQIDRIDAGHR